MTLCLPSMQEWGTIFTTSQADVQLTFSGYVVAYGALQLVYGPLSDRHGRKPILMLGLVVAGLASVMAALATDIAQLTAARVLQGAGSAASMVVSRSMVQDLFAGPQRTRVMAYIGMALGMCPPLATLLGGQIHVHFGWQTNFVLLAVLAVSLLVAAWLGLPRVAKSAPAPGHWLRAMLSAYARLLREPRFLLYVAILAATTATFYAFLAGAPIVLKGYGIGPDGIGWFIMAVPVSYILGNFMTSRLIAQAGESRVMAWGQALTLGGLVVMLALGLGGVQTALAVALPLLLLGLGHGLLNPPALAGTVGVVPALAGSAAAVAGLMQQLTGATGGYLVGLVPHEGAVNLGWMMLAFALTGALAQFFLRRR
jgi:DHA1 family bicyclomycin/chloramphenicol resistance-like MFS transporter